MVTQHKTGRRLRNLRGEMDGISKVLCGKQKQEESGPLARSVPSPNIVKLEHKHTTFSRLLKEAVSRSM